MMGERIVKPVGSGGLIGAANIATGLKFVVQRTVAPYLTTKSRYEGSAARPEILPRSGPVAG